MKRTSEFTLALVFATGFPVTAQLQPARTFILIGPPGSGKTVQAEALRKQYKIPAVSMSELLHKEVNRRTPLGEAVAAQLNSGELLGDDAANELIKRRLLQPDVAHGFILDGYPATEGQAKTLDQWLFKNKLPKPIIIVLNVPEEVSRDRMIRRRREGDKPDNIERRLRDYREVGRLVEQWYGGGRIVRVDGTGTPVDVAQRIAKGIEAVQSAPGLKVRSPEEGTLKQREPVPSATEQKQQR